jgi:hypothetical protein
MDLCHTKKQHSLNVKSFRRNASCGLLILCIALPVCPSVLADYKPANGPLMTRWAMRISPNNVHPEYPRPQMVRKSWENLNGLWDYSIVHKDQPKPDTFDGQILVPFPAESALSGVMKPVGQDNRLWYRRTFRVPRTWQGQLVLLHFGAVDFDTTVWVNGTQVGTHLGGYDSFYFDITDAIKEIPEQEIVVSVWDPTDAGTQPRGKQVSKPGGIWYTAVTGIWQTVWAEPVPQAYIKSLKITPDVDNKTVSITAECSEPGGYSVEAETKVGWFSKVKNKGNAGQEIILSFKKPKLWSPDSPSLYDVTVTLRDDKGKKVDVVSSYFGLRKIEVKKDTKGVDRLFLNNEPLFQFGPLDQGWWPDGLYTAPSDAALSYDIEVLKKLGCNMLRKHVKIEPARFYYWCDKLGLMVWQDMPSGDKYIGGRDPDIQRSSESAKEFETELTEMITNHYNHPCIVIWVPYNEGWGQWDTPRIVELIKKLDPTRLVDNASGWTDRGVGDVHDIHSYPGPAMPPLEEKRAAVLGEFGGLGLPVEGHTWQQEKSWGYRKFKTREDLTDAYVTLIDNLRPLIGDGLSAAVYTQTTDVEVEVNGLMTYDREMIKMDVKKVTAANKRLYLPPPILKTIVPTSQSQPQSWRYTTSEPNEGWQQADFNDSNWQTGQGGFGTKTTPGAVVRTEWKTPDIWMRRTFELKDAKLSQPQLVIHHDENAEVYINGQLAAKLEGYTTSYLRAALDEQAQKSLKAGTNCIAIHCHQTTGGQYIDAGIVDVIEQSER